MIMLGRQSVVYSLLSTRYQPCAAAPPQVPTMLKHGDLHIVQENPSLFALSLVTGFAVNALAYSTIQLASSLTLKVLPGQETAFLIRLGVLVIRIVIIHVQLPL